MLCVHLFASLSLIVCSSICSIAISQSIIYSLIAVSLSLKALRFVISHTISCSELRYPFILVTVCAGEAMAAVSLGDEFSNLDVSVKFSRRYTFYLLTLYIPTVLLILIAYATFFFNPDDFNSRVVVAVTSLLVLTSLLTQVTYSGARLHAQSPWLCDG